MSQSSFPILPPFHTVVLDSSAIAQVTYEHPREILHVEFRDGSVHQYSTVSAGAYQEFLCASSKGAHFNRYIRNQFPQHAVRGPRPSN
jgi:hypothetical protein